MLDGVAPGGGQINTSGRGGGVRMGNWTPEDTRILQILASVLASQNREETAVALLEYALAREPENAEVKQALCGAYFLLGRYTDALEMAEASLAAGATGTARLGLLLVRSRSLWGLGRPGEARSAMNQYLSERRQS